MTVIRGESPLIVCTRDTGIRDIASEFNMCPPIWNAVKGNVARMISLFGRRIPFFKTGKVFRMKALRLASHDRKRHQKDTRRNCMMVRVTGFGKAVKIALEDVLVRMEVAYQKAHSI